MSCFNIWKTEYIDCKLELASLKMSYFCLIAWVSEVKVAQSCLTLCDAVDCTLPGSSVHGDSPGKNTGVGCHALLQGIFPTQESNPGLPYCRQILYQLSHKGSPTIKFKIHQIQWQLKMCFLKPWQELTVNNASYPTTQYTHRCIQDGSVQTIRHPSCLMISNIFYFVLAYSVSLFCLMRVSAH